MACCGRKAASAWMAAVGVILIVIGLAVYPIIDIVEESTLEKEGVLKDGTTMFKSLYQEPSPPVTFNYYLWSISNPEKFLSGEEKAKYTQKGPYAYTEIYTKYDVTQENGAFENSSYVEYTQGISYHWSEEDSCPDCNQDDVIVNVNIVAAALLGIVKNVMSKRPSLAGREFCVTCDDESGFCSSSIKPTCGPNQKKTFEEYMMGEVDTIFTKAGAKMIDDTKTVGELLWGFTDPIFDQLAAKFEHSAENGVLSDVWAEVADLFKTLEYGMVGGKNGTAEDPGASWDNFKVHNGNGDVSKTGQLLAWGDKTHLAPWYGDDPVSYCNRIAGTDGQTVPAGTTVNDILDIFVSDLTMTIWMTHGASDTYRGQNGDASFKIPVEIFYSPPMVFQLASRPKNQCFCSPNLPDGWCTNKDGVFLVDQGMAGVPLVISGPHFASASEYFHTTIEGMNPVSPPHFSMDNNEHTSYCAYELTSGAIIYNAKKVQFSFMVKKEESISIYNNDQVWQHAPEDVLVLPVFWINETTALPDDLAEDIFKLSVYPLNVAHGLQYALFAIGGLLVLLAICNLFRSEPGEVEPTKKDSFEKELDTKNNSKNPYEQEFEKNSAKVSVSL